MDKDIIKLIEEMKADIEVLDNEKDAQTSNGQLTECEINDLLGALSPSELADLSEQNPTGDNGANEILTQDEVNKIVKDYEPEQM